MSPPSDVKRRPKNRKVQIAGAAADAFSAMGYHAVSMERIAARVGISAAALYRHAPSKYALFRDAVYGLGQQLVDATAFADHLADDADPVDLLDALLDALITTTIANRSAGGLYRWEGRYLRDADRVTLLDQIGLVNRRLQRPLAQVRPELSSPERWTLSSAALSVIGSIADHRARLPVGEIRHVLGAAARSALAAQLPPRPTLPCVSPVTVDPPLADVGKYEVLLRESLRLFNAVGYRETSMEDIAAASGVPASSIYRYFTGKGDILAAAYRRAADRVSGDLSDVLRSTSNPEGALCELMTAYIARSFDSPELANVYYSERHNLPSNVRTALHGAQRSTVESWVQLLVSARPDIGTGHARLAVHAGFALVVDLGRLVDYANTGHSRECVHRLMHAVLFG